MSRCPTIETPLSLTWLWHVTISHFEHYDLACFTCIMIGVQYPILGIPKCQDKRSLEIQKKKGGAEVLVWGSTISYLLSVHTYGFKGSRKVTLWRHVCSAAQLTHKECDRPAACYGIALPPATPDITQNPSTLTVTTSAHNKCKHDWVVLCTFCW